MAAAKIPNLIDITYNDRGWSLHCGTMSDSLVFDYLSQCGDITDVSSLLNICRDVKAPHQIVNACVAAETVNAFFGAAENALLAGKTEIKAYSIGCMAKNDLWIEKFHAVVKISASGSLGSSVSDGFSFLLFPGSHRWCSDGYPMDRKLERGEVVTLKMMAIANEMHAELRRIVCMRGISTELAEKIDHLK